MVHIDLRDELSNQELSEFLARAKAAGMTADEYFKRITIGKRTDSEDAA